jgi:hypothetical protein
MKASTKDRAAPARTDRTDVSSSGTESPAWAPGTVEIRLLVIQDRLFAIQDRLLAIQDRLVVIRERLLAI